MYDRQWTRTIVDGFRNVCARANNIEMCLIETVYDITTLTITQASLYKSLLWALQRGDKSRLWYKYKRLCKVSPLDVELLKATARILIEVQGLRLDDENQLTLDFT